MSFFSINDSTSATTEANLLQVREHCVFETKISRVAGASSDSTTQLTGKADISSEVILHSLEEPKWGLKKERRFSQLAAKEALDSANQEELNELNHLQMIRRRAKAAPTLDQIIHTLKRHRIEDELMEMMHRYVEFLQSPDKTEASGR